MVVVTVETDRDVIEIAAPHIAPSEPRCDREAVVEHRPDIDGVIVISHAELGTLGSGLSLRGILLDEIRDRRRLGPHGLIKATVHLDGGSHPDGPRPRRRLVVILGVDCLFRSCFSASLAGPGPLCPRAQRGRQQDESEENESEEDSQWKR